MRTLVAQLGARRHYAVPRALAMRRLLAGLATDICADAAPWPTVAQLWPERLRPRGLRRMLQRHAEGVPVERIHNFTTFALSPGLRRRKGEAASDHWARRNAAFGRAVAASGFGDAGAVYGFNGAALEIFEAARQHGLRTVLDQTAAPWRWNARLLAEEEARWPGWEEASDDLDRSGRLSAREEAEWQLADAIVCGSRFSADALDESGGPSGRCAVVPYAGHVEPMDLPPRSSTKGRRLRVLMVGTLQLRKGVQYLPEVMGRLRGEAVELRLVGPSRLSPKGLAALGAVAEIAGPASRAAVRGYYGWADVFLLPTLSEGSANVCYEAMAAGLPVVTTPNAGSIVRHGHDGLIVPARDPEAMAEALASLASDEGRRLDLAECARLSISAAGLQTYADGLSKAVGSPGGPC